MKAILEFNLPEDQEEFYQAHSGAALFDATEEFRAWLRGRLKHTDLGLARDFAQETWDKFHIFTAGILE
jgi:hypothetical protein